jgi:hypothetical protein
LEDLGVERTVISEWLFMGHGVDRSGSGYGQVAGISECGNELLDYIKCGKYFD